MSTTTPTTTTTRDRGDRYLPAEGVAFRLVQLDGETAELVTVDRGQVGSSRDGCESVGRAAACHRAREVCVLIIVFNERRKRPT